jgi:DNA invertase Pin-like site-specific DNA recombinase
MKETLHILSRVSTSNQSFEEQKVKGMEYSQRLNMGVKFYDELCQGNDLKKRPILQDIFEDIESGKIKHLWVKDLSRLTRNQTEKTLFYKIFQDNGVILHTENGIVDLDRFENKLIYEIFDMIQNYEKRKRKTNNE